MVIGFDNIESTGQSLQMDIDFVTGEVGINTYLPAIGSKECDFWGQAIACHLYQIITNKGKIYMLRSW